MSKKAAPSRVTWPGERYQKAYPNEPGFIQRTRTVCVQTVHTFVPPSNNRATSRVDTNHDDDDDAQPPRVLAIKRSSSASAAEPASKKVCVEEEADQALAAANPKTTVGGGNLDPDGGLGGRYKLQARNNVWINTDTGVLVVIDWDLTIDYISTPYDAHAFEECSNGRTIRQNIVAKCGYTEDDEENYMEKMADILYHLMRLRDLGHCDVVIVTRNSVKNVEDTIDYCWDSLEWIRKKLLEPFNHESFPIISYPENNVVPSDKKDKARLVLQHFPNVKSVDEVIFVDDSHGKPTCEHERFEESAPWVFSNAPKISYVKVKRCPRYKIASKRGRKPWPYGEQGLGNQPDALDKLATLILANNEKPSCVWADIRKEIKDWE